MSILKTLFLWVCSVMIWFPFFPTSNWLVSVHVCVLHYERMVLKLFWIPISSDLIAVGSIASGITWIASVHHTGIKLPYSFLLCLLTFQTIAYNFEKEAKWREAVQSYVFLFFFPCGIFLPEWNSLFTNCPSIWQEVTKTVWWRSLGLCIWLSSAMSCGVSFQPPAAYGWQYQIDRLL